MDAAGAAMAEHLDNAEQTFALLGETLGGDVPLNSMK